MRLRPSRNDKAGFDRLVSQVVKNTSIATRGAVAARMLREEWFAEARRQWQLWASDKAVTAMLEAALRHAQDEISSEG